jgi:hypothetical protein
MESLSRRATARGQALAHGQISALIDSRRMTLIRAIS